MLAAAFEGGERAGGAAVSHQPGQDRRVVHERVGEIQGLLLEPVERGALCGGVFSDQRGTVVTCNTKFGSARPSVSWRWSVGISAATSAARPSSISASPFDQPVRHVRLEAQYVLRVGQGLLRTIELYQQLRGVEGWIPIEGIQPRRLLHARK